MVVKFPISVSDPLWGLLGTSPAALKNLIELGGPRSKLSGRHLPHNCRRIGPKYDIKNRSGTDLSVPHLKRIHAVYRQVSHCRSETVHRLLISFQRSNNRNWGQRIDNVRVIKDVELKGEYP